MNFTKKFITNAFATMLVMGAFTTFTSCDGADGIDGINGVDGEDGEDGADGADGKDGEDANTTDYTNVLEQSVTPDGLVKLGDDFSSATLEVVMSSADILPESPEFIYGSMADGAGLMEYNDDSYALIQNLERDYSVARILLSKDDLKPITGEYIMDAYASGFTNMCSATLAMPDIHGFGPYFLTAAEWQGSEYGAFGLNPFRSSDSKSYATKLDALGEWSAENAVPIGKDAYGSGTVVFIGDDDSFNDYPRGHFAMYVGYDQFGGQDTRMGNLSFGKRFVLKFTDDTVDPFEAQIAEGETVDVEWTEIEALYYDEINTEAVADGAIGFSRIEDIDFRKGTAENQREIYFCVTGRNRDGHIGDGTEANPKRGTELGRIYKLVMNAEDPEQTAQLTCILDGDDTSSVAYSMGLHSPDNITVTEDYIYIQEDPNDYADSNPNIGDSSAKIYQYNITTGDMKVALYCDQIFGAENDYGSTETYWEIGGMIDVTDVIGASETTFLLATQNHGWEADINETATRADGATFTDPNATPDLTNETEGSVLYKVTGLE